MSGIVRPTRPKRFFYAQNVNISYSFDRLQQMAEKMLGASLEEGDIMICDNGNLTKRKVLQMTKKGFMIYYARLHGKQVFVPLAKENGVLKDPGRELL